MDLDMDFGWLWMSPCGWRRRSEMDMDFGWLWTSLEFLLQSDRNGYGFWMAMDESIRMERVDVMWCRLGNRMRRISFVIGILEFV